MTSPTSACKTRKTPPLPSNIILAADKSQAELFGADHAESLILDSVKGGYASADGKTRLLNTQNGWSIRK